MYCTRTGLSEHQRCTIERERVGDEGSEGSDVGDDDEDKLFRRLRTWFPGSCYHDTDVCA